MRTNKTLIALTIASTAAVALVACPAAQLTPQEREQQTMQRVASTLDYGHVSGQRLDDVISRRALKTYLEALDPLKLYFLQGDVDRLAAFQDQLDDVMMAGDPRFAREVFGLYLERLDQRVELARELLGSKLDFSVDERFVLDPKERHYARDEGEARDLWRRRIKHDLLTLEASGTGGEEATERVRRR